MKLFPGDIAKLVACQPEWADYLGFPLRVVGFGAQAPTVLEGSDYTVRTVDDRFIGANERNVVRAPEILKERSWAQWRALWLDPKERRLFHRTRNLQRIVGTTIVGPL